MYSLIYLNTIEFLQNFFTYSKSLFKKKNQGYNRKTVQSPGKFRSVRWNLAPKTCISKVRNVLFIFRNLNHKKVNDLKKLKKFIRIVKN